VQEAVIKEAESQWDRIIEKERVRRLQYPKCQLDLDILLGKAGKSWKTDDEEKTVTDEIEFTKSIREGKIGLRGNNTDKTVWWMSGDRLVNVQSQVYAEMDGEGRLVWSNGFTSEFEGGLCRVALRF